MRNKNITSVYVDNKNLEKLKELKIKLLEHSFETNAKAVSLSALFNLFLEEVLDDPEKLESLMKKHCGTTLSEEQNVV